MNPSFRAGDTVLVNRLSYFLSKPKIGDVIVLKQRKFIIKRIAKVKEKKVFVVGDNKKESADSRKFGWIEKGNIIGKVILEL